MRESFLVVLLASAVPARADNVPQADSQFNRIMRKNVLSSKSSGDVRAPDEVRPGEGRLPLSEYEALRNQLRESRERAQHHDGVSVILGSTRYDGRVVDGVLRMRVSMHVTLRGPHRWKKVPLIGSSVVVQRASDGKRELSLLEQDGYHVWVTQQSGEWDLQVDIAVAPSGPEGSIEYDFRVARTPVTQVSVRFLNADLEPRVDSAVRATVTTGSGTSLLEATLRPTTRMRMVGFRRLSQAAERESRVYVDNLNLVSLEQGNLQLFTVLQYRILYAGAKSFEIRIPSGLTVLSAEGEGAFRYVTETSDEGLVLRGETAFPIRDRYEISLRLEKKLDAGSGKIELQLPHAISAEREEGWVGLEVPDKLQLEVGASENARRVDVRQLPGVIANSAVSPVLAAFRFDRPGLKIGLNATELPEKEPVNGSIDFLRAWTVVAEQGAALTEIELTLRNRLRHRLSIRLPEHARVQTALLDGEPVKPSRDEQGSLILPLRRSRGADRLESFKIQIVYEHDHPRFWWFGRKLFQLPTVDLPVSSVHWRFYLPRRNVYSRITSEVAEQTLAGFASESVPTAWPFSSLRTDRATPTALKVPRSGRELNFRRYWLAASESLEIRFWFARLWLRTPILMFLWILLAYLGFRLKDAGLGAPMVRWPTWRWTLGFGLAGAILLLYGSGVFACFSAVLVGALFAVALRVPVVMTWFRSLPEQLLEVRTLAVAEGAWRVVWRVAMTGVLALLLLLLAIVMTQWVIVLGNPIG